MSARELGVSDPLDVAGRAYKLVPGDRVIVRAMQEMGPVIDLVRPGLDRALPLAVGLDQQNPLGHQHPHHLGRVKLR